MYAFKLFSVEKNVAYGVSDSIDHSKFESIATCVTIIIIIIWYILRHVQTVVVDSNDAYGTSEIGCLSCGKFSDYITYTCTLYAFTIVLVHIYRLMKPFRGQKRSIWSYTPTNGYPAKFEDDTPHIYECPDSMMETKPN